MFPSLPVWTPVYGLQATATTEGQATASADTWGLPHLEFVFLVVSIMQRWGRPRKSAKMCTTQSRRKHTGALFVRFAVSGRCRRRLTQGSAWIPSLILCVDAVCGAVQLIRNSRLRDERAYVLSGSVHPQV